MQLNKSGKKSIMQNDGMQHAELSMQLGFIDFTFIELKGGYNN